MNNNKAKMFAEAQKQYEEDGAAILRGVIDPEWILKLSEGTEGLMQDPKSGHNFNKKGEGRFFGDVFAWLRTDEYKDFIFNSNIAEIASEMLKSEIVRFFYDQPLVKEPGTPKPTPWHQDYPYWPTGGDQVLSVWVPLDACGPYNGVVTYVKGSHKWNSFYPVEDWADEEIISDSLNKSDTNKIDLGQERAGENPKGNQLRTMADVRDHPEKYEFLTWDVQPGDVLIHHSHTIHGAQGNLTADKRRRAVAFRFLGDNARWDDSRPHIFKDIKKMDPSFPYPDHKTGDKITAPIFPVVWPKTDAP